MIIAIDGPAGAGKSTVARAAAKELGYIYVDTGALYRTVALYIVKNNIDSDDISAVAPLDVTAFDRNQYTQIESTLWNDKINELSRSVNKNLSLTANGGYSYTESNKSSSVNAGVNGSYNGLSVSARVNVPIQNENQQQGKGKQSPTVTVGVTYSPNTFKKNKLSDETTAITIEQEEMKHDSVYDAYETAVQERIIKLSDLEWTKTTNQKET